MTKLVIMCTERIYYLRCPYINETI